MNLLLQKIGTYKNRPQKVVTACIEPDEGPFVQPFWVL